MKLVIRPDNRRYRVRKNGHPVSAVAPGSMSWSEALALANREADRRGKPHVEIINNETLEVVWSANAK